jgi:glycosyltransferase involved in cell wall biosynthesis
MRSEPGTVSGTRSEGARATAAMELGRPLRACALRGHPTLISVIIPIRNCEAHVADQLHALAHQTYRDAWELIVVDNGCSDRSVEIVESFQDEIPSLTVVTVGKRGLGRARNAGARAARGDLLAYCDADDVAAPEWLEALAQAASLGDIVGGLSEFEALNSELQRSWQPADPMTALNSGYGFLPYPSGGSCAIWADVARSIGWDDSFRFGASDIEFGWRAQIAGYRLAFAPQAVMSIRFRPRPGSIARQRFRYGMSQPYLFRRFRDHGMPRSDPGEAYEAWCWLARNAVRHLRSAQHRGNWLRLAGMRSGRIYGSIRWRSLYL